MPPVNVYISENALTPTKNIIKYFKNNSSRLKQLRLHIQFTVLSNDEAIQKKSTGMTHLPALTFRDKTIMSVSGIKEFLDGLATNSPKKLNDTGEQMLNYMNNELFQNVTASGSGKTRKLIIDEKNDGKPTNAKFGEMDLSRRIQQERIRRGIDANKSDSQRPAPASISTNQMYSQPQPIQQAPQPMRSVQPIQPTRPNNIAPPSSLNQEIGSIGRKQVLTDQQYALNKFANMGIDMEAVSGITTL
jgi:hypothetical protein